MVSAIEFVVGAAIIEFVMDAAEFLVGAPQLIIGTAKLIVGAPQFIIRAAVFAFILHATEFRFIQSGFAAIGGAAVLLRVRGMR